MAQVDDSYSRAWADAVLLVVRFSSWGVNRMIDGGAIATAETADRDRIKAHKVLIDAPEYDAIAKHYSDVRLWMNKRTNPAGFLGPSVHLVKRAVIEDVSGYLDDARVTLGALLDTFGAWYDVRVNEAARESTGLGQLFDRSQYPSFDAVRARYSIRSRFVSVGPAQGLTDELSRAEVAGFVADWRATVDEARDALRAEFAELVAYFAERLQESSVDGKKSRIGGNFAKIETLREFCSLFSARDLAGDGDLRAMAERVKLLLSGVDVGALKSSASFRAGLAEQFDGIKREAGGLIQAGSSRLFTFDTGADDQSAVA